LQPLAFPQGCRARRRVFLLALFSKLRSSAAASASAIAPLAPLSPRFVPGVVFLGNLHSPLSLGYGIELGYSCLVIPPAFSWPPRKILPVFERCVSDMGFSSAHGLVLCTVVTRQKIPR
jgi:hypothetical protein